MCVGGCVGVGVMIERMYECVFSSQIIEFECSLHRNVSKIALCILIKKYIDFLNDLSFFLSIFPSFFNLNFTEIESWKINIIFTQRVKPIDRLKI